MVSRVYISEITSQLYILCTMLHNVFFLSLLRTCGNLTTAFPSPDAVTISRTTQGHSWRVGVQVMDEIDVARRRFWGSPW